MTILIDGHNLIGAMPDIDLSDPDDEWQLVRRLQAHFAGRQDRVTVVFDSGGAPSPGWELPAGGLAVRFAPPGSEADALILQILHRSPRPGQVSVVTNDQGLAGLVRAAGGQVRSASQFARQLRAGPLPGQPQPDAEPLPDPHDPAFADIFHGFAAADKDEARFGGRIDQDSARWIERLYGDDPAEAGRAAHWLGRFGGPAALEPLLDALTHRQAPVRAAALLALADLGDPAAAAAVAERLAGDGTSLVREAAARALARLGGPLAEPALRAALADEKRKVRKAAQAGLEQVRARG